MERERLIGHLLDHYIARDMFRFEARDILQRRGMETACAHLDTSYGSKNPQPAARVVENTGASLDKCKQATLDHLHALLHEAPVLDKDEHLHTDEDIFRYIIEEEDAA